MISDMSYDMKLKISIITENQLVNINEKRKNMILRANFISILNSTATSFQKS